MYLVSLIENGQLVPSASDIADIPAGQGKTTYVSDDMNAYRRDTRAVKKMLSIPAWLAKEAEDNNISLSKVLQDALKENFIWHKKQQHRLPLKSNNRYFNGSCAGNKHHGIPVWF